jgi:hypothetical protein
MTKVYSNAKRIINIPTFHVGNFHTACRVKIYLWSYHLDCKKGGDKREAKFIGWLPCDDYDEDELEDYSDASLINHKRFPKKYNPKLWQYENMKYCHFTRKARKNK